MTKCIHKDRRCLNHHETFRKYLCQDCGGVFICECEQEIATVLFPHQSRIGREAGSADEYEVTGYASICATCRGEREEAHPRAQIYGQKEKIGRYYWREIGLTSLRKVLEFLKDKKETVKDVFDFDRKFPDIRERFKKEARQFWLQRHKKDPLYVYSDRSEHDFLKKVSVPTIEISAPYVNRDGKGLWVSENGAEVPAEAFVAERYRRQGYQVYRCERRIVSTLVATFLWTPINEPDEKLQIVGFGSRGKFSKTLAKEFNKHGILWFQKPRDFGTKEFYERKRVAFQEWLGLLRSPGNDLLLGEFNYFLGASWALRDYLWVHNDEAEEATRAFLKVVPDNITFKLIEWAAGDFWHRQPGWPDLFIVKDREHLFVEVKGPNDQLSPDQMNWFEKILSEKLLNCSIIRLKKAAASP